MSTPATGRERAWDSQWLSIRLTSGDRNQVSFLRWYVEAPDGLLLLVAGDDSMLDRMDPETTVDVAAVRSRGSSRAHRNYAAARLEKLETSAVERVSRSLNEKYGWRRRLFRPGFWLARRLGRPKAARLDVPLRIALTGE